MLLSYLELKQIVMDGVVENCPEELINGASIDATLGDEFLIEMVRGPDDSIGSRVVEYSVREKINALSRNRGRPPSWCALKPGELIWVSTQQIFNLPNDLAMDLRLKSSAARTGLEVLGNAWGDPTWNNAALTLGVKNQTRYHTIILRPGDRIAQVCFWRCAPVPDEAAYKTRGRYNGDKGVAQIKP